MKKHHQIYRDKTLLKQRFEPNNDAMKVQMKSEFQQIKLDGEEDNADP
jgi:hypothetical protein